MKIKRTLMKIFDKIVFLFCILFLSILFTMLLSILNISTADWCQINNVFYVIIGILYSISLSITISFSFSNVPNDNFVNKYRNELSRNQHYFTAYFWAASIIEIFNYLFANRNIIKMCRFRIDLNIVWLLLFMYIIFIMGLNFHELNTLKEKIEDKIRKNN